MSYDRVLTICAPTFCFDEAITFKYEALHCPSVILFMCLFVCKRFVSSIFLLEINFWGQKINKFLIKYLKRAFGNKHFTVFFFLNNIRTFFVVK